jgi:hypothetical protein
MGTAEIVVGFLRVSMSNVLPLHTGRRFRKRRGSRPWTRLTVINDRRQDPDWIDREPFYVDARSHDVVIGPRLQYYVLVKQCCRWLCRASTPFLLLADAVARPAHSCLIRRHMQDAI